MLVYLSQEEREEMACVAATNLTIPRTVPVLPHLHYKQVKAQWQSAQLSHFIEK